MKPNELRNKINERNWELLLDAINEGKVVPIIGEDLIIQLVHVLSYDKAATVAWSFMAPVYKQMLEYIHKELIEALAMFTAMEKNPMQIVYVSALDKLQELDSNNNDLRKYRDEACRTSYLDYYRKSILEISAN